MNLPPQAHWRTVVIAAVLFLAISLCAQETPNFLPPGRAFSAWTNGGAMWRNGKSPVDFFRQLLAMTPEEREQFLTNRPPEIRARILLKVGEYEALDPNERALRLRATELRWYLVPLLRESPTNQTVRLAQIPAEVRGLVQARLEEWIILPPTLKQEFLDNERILHYFAHVDAGGGPVESTGHGPSEADRAQWNQLSEAERRQVTDGFNQFFDLTPDEKQQALGTLSEAERRQMEKTLQSFEKMPAAQRTECVGAFAKFASMSAREQTEFLKNAERWSALSPAERQAWRDLVVNVPQWPPLPIGFVTPVAGESRSGVATNRE